MNLQPLFETQKILDQRIIKQHGLEGQNLLSQKILALQVELGECANEWRGFKFWSKDPYPKPPQHNWRASEDGMNQEWLPEWGYESYPLLEEYVDCLHFILSIGLELPVQIQGMEKYLVFGTYPGRSNIFVLNKLFKDISSLQEGDENDILSAYYGTFQWFLELGSGLGFTWEQIEQAYYSKNEINHTRQDTGY